MEKMDLENLKNKYAGLLSFQIEGDEFHLLVEEIERLWEVTNEHKTIEEIDAELLANGIDMRKSYSKVMDFLDMKIQIESLTVQVKKLGEENEMLQEQFIKDGGALDTAYIKNLESENAEWMRRSSDADARVLRLTNENAALTEQIKKVEWYREKVGSLFDKIKHGDDEHKAWLNKAIQEHFND